MEKRHNSILRGIAMLLFAVPLCTNIRYLLFAWRTSPLDHWQWAWWCVACLLAVVFHRRIIGWAYPRWRLVNITSWGIGIFSAAVIGYGTVKHIYAFRIIGSLMFLFSGMYILYGERLFSGMFPLLGISFIGIPSSTYWIAYYLHWFRLGGAYYVKLLIAIVLGVAFCLISRPLRIQKLAFACVLAAALTFAVIQNRPAKKGDLLDIRLDGASKAGWCVEECSLDDMDRIFFYGADVQKYLIIRKGKMVAFSWLVPRKKIHSLHPVEICLLSGGYTLESSKEVLLDVRGKQVAALETVVHDKNVHFLIYSIYMGTNWSTGNFVSFRHHWRKDEKWICYQLSTILKDDVEEGRELVKEVLEVVGR